MDRALQRYTSKLLSLFPVPKYLSENVLGVDISDHAIRYIEFLSRKNHIVIGRHGKIDVPRDVVVSGVIKDEEALLGVLQRIKRESNGEMVHASLPTESAYFFSKMIVVGKPHYYDVRNILEFTLEEDVPVGPENVLFDHQIAPVRPTKNEYKTAVQAIPRDVVSQYESLYRKAGFIPLSFEVESQSIMRSVVAYSDKRTAMIVDFGELKTGIAIVSKGLLVYATTIEVGSSAMTKAIAKTFSITFAEAEKKKKETGFRQTKENERQCNALINMASVLRDEINRHMMYWNTHKDRKGVKNGEVGRVILCGGGANLAGMDTYLSASLDIQVVLANTWINAFSPEDYVPSIEYGESLSYVTAVGLALKGII